MSLLPTLKGYMPDFSGFSSPAWAPLLSGARYRAAGARAFLQMHHEFDREDFLKFFAEAADPAKQCATLAKSFCQTFAIQLALKLGIPHGVRFDRYDPASGRIVVLVPLGTVRRLSTVARKSATGRLTACGPASSRRFGTSTGRWARAKARR